MSILLNGKNTEVVQDLVNRIFDVCPAMEILFRDTDAKGKITRIPDRVMFIRRSVSVDSTLERLDTVINLDSLTDSEDFNQTVLGYRDVSEEFAPELRNNNGLWVNVVTNPGSSKIRNAMYSALAAFVRMQAQEEDRRRITGGSQITYVNIKLQQETLTRLNADLVCLLIDYISRYRDILINMPGLELRLN